MSCTKLCPQAQAGLPLDLDGAALSRAVLSSPQASSRDDERGTSPFSPGVSAFQRIWLSGGTWIPLESVAREEEKRILEDYVIDWGTNSI